MHEIKFQGTDMSMLSVFQWELVCDRSYLSNLVQSVFMGGILAGSLLFGWVADKYGRRHTVYLSLAGKDNHKHTVLDSCTLCSDKVSL